MSALAEWDRFRDDRFAGPQNEGNDNQQPPLLTVLRVPTVPLGEHDGRIEPARLKCLVRGSLRSGILRGVSGDELDEEKPAQQGENGVGTEIVKTKFILIDYENVHTFSPADLSVIKGGEFEVKLFLGVHNKEIGVDLVEALFPIASRVELIRLKATGTNALDFLIAFHVGKLWQETPDAVFYIISRDTDSNSLIKNLQAIGVDIHRRPCIADVEKEVPAGTPSMADLVATATVGLGKNPHRPSTLKKLRNVLRVSKDLSEEQLLELIGALTESGVIQVVGNKVSYHLEGRVRIAPTVQP